MVVEHIFGDYIFRTSFKFNKDGLIIVVLSMIKDATVRNYTEGEKLGMDIKSNSMNISHEETKQLANFIVKHYKGDKLNAV